jgi:hypothetical protein
MVIFAVPKYCAKRDTVGKFGLLRGQPCLSLIQGYFYSFQADVNVLRKIFKAGSDIFSFLIICHKEFPMRPYTHSNGMEVVSVGMQAICCHNLYSKALPGYTST